MSPNLKAETRLADLPALEPAIAFLRHHLLSVIFSKIMQKLNISLIKLYLSTKLILPSRICITFLRII